MIFCTIRDPKVKPVFKFKVKPFRDKNGQRTKEYLTVFYWKDKATLEKANGCEQTIAFHSGYERRTYGDGDSYTVSPDIGELHFCPDSMCLSYVAHEATHAALARFRKKRESLDEDPPFDKELVITKESAEERFCILVEELVWCVCDGLSKRLGVTIEDRKTRHEDKTASGPVGKVRL